MQCRCRLCKIKYSKPFMASGYFKRFSFVVLRDKNSVQLHQKRLFFPVSLVGLIFFELSPFQSLFLEDIKIEHVATTFLQCFFFSFSFFRYVFPTLLLHQGKKAKLGTFDVHCFGSSGQDIWNNQQISGVQLSDFGADSSQRTPIYNEIFMRPPEEKAQKRIRSSDNQLGVVAPSRKLGRTQRIHENREKTSLPTPR